MAVNALERGMGAEQRKPVLVSLDFPCVQIPAIHRVALLAICAELASVNIGVAVGAFRADVLKIQVGMALRACHSGVFPAKGIPGLIVVKFRDAADRFPAGGRVAVFARDCDGAVRVARVGPLSLCPCRPLP